MRYIILLALFFSPLAAEDAPQQPSSPLRQLNITEFTLKNGMKVCLKPVADTEEIMVQIFALGGAAAFPRDEAAARLAPAVALESGLGDYSYEAISKVMSDFGTDYAIRIQPYQRLIEGSCYQEGLEHLLKWSMFAFTAPHFTEAGLAKVILQTRDSIQNLQQDCDTLFEEHFMSINTQGKNVQTTPTLADLNLITTTRSKEIFTQCYRNPGEFTCVIVGDITVDQATIFLNKTLAMIPIVQDQPPLVDQGIGNNFPPDITTSVFRCGHDDESLTRITFPLKLHDEEMIFEQLEFVSQVIETRLRNSIRAQRGTTHAIDVGYEFPQYPHLSSKWMTLQFRSAPDEVKQLVKLSLSEVEKLRREGPLETEIQAVDLLLQRTDEFWATENSYWVAMISNYYKWGWSLAHLVKTRDPMSKEQIQKFLQDSFSMNNYSVVIRNKNEK